LSDPYKPKTQGIDHKVVAYDDGGFDSEVVTALTSTSAMVKGTVTSLIASDKGTSKVEDAEVMVRIV